MPSPLAHSAVAFLLWPSLRKSASARAGGQQRSLKEPDAEVRAAGSKLSKSQTLVLLGGVLFMLNAPDLDMIPHLLWGKQTWLVHGGPTHSLLAGALAAIGFASVLHWMYGIDWIRLWIIGALAWWSHILLDFFTLHGGVAALWPITAERFASPVPLFYGVRHSQPWAWNLHLITIGTELIFVGLMWLVGRRLSRRVVKSQDRNRIVDGTFSVSSQPASP